MDMDKILLRFDDLERRLSALEKRLGAAQVTQPRYQLRVSSAEIGKRLQAVGCYDDDWLDIWVSLPSRVEGLRDVNHEITDLVFDCYYEPIEATEGWEKVPYRRNDPHGDDDPREPLEDMPDGLGAKSIAAMEAQGKDDRIRELTQQLARVTQEKETERQNANEWLAQAHDARRELELQYATAHQSAAYQRKRKEELEQEVQRKGNRIEDLQGDIVTLQERLKDAHIRSESLERELKGTEEARKAACSVMETNADQARMAWNQVEKLKKEKAELRAEMKRRIQEEAKACAGIASHWAWDGPAAIRIAETLWHRAEDMNSRVTTDKPWVTCAACGGHWWEQMASAKGVDCTIFCPECGTDLECVEAEAGDEGVLWTWALYHRNRQALR